MNLSPDQISALKKLISFKGYDEIDVQYEILDHVACRLGFLGLVTLRILIAKVSKRSSEPAIGGV
jgi:hypothetical protein